MTENTGIVNVQDEQSAFQAILNGTDPLSVRCLVTNHTEALEETERAFADGGTDAARKVLFAYAKGDDALMKMLCGGNIEPIAVVLTGTSKLNVPPLPKFAHIDQSVALNACPWLDEYIEFSRKWSPRSYANFHEACGLFTMSTAAAGRVKCNYGGERHTSLYIALVARTSKHAKTTAAKISKEVLSSAGLNCLLVPDEMTPQAFVEELSDNKLPTGWADMREELKEWHLGRVIFAGQRGWYYDEFGQKVSGMMKTNGHMGDYRGLLRVMDNGEPDYRYKTRGHGEEIIEPPYLALLASMTPADLQPFAGRNAPLWGDGFWARFAFVAPPCDEKMSRGRFPDEIKRIPINLSSVLALWHKTLGIPKIKIDEDDLGNKTITVHPESTTPLGLGTGVRDAIHAYEDALSDITDSGEFIDLDGNYSRLSEKALRIAALMASMQSCENIEMRHWARAQQIVERWRADLHSLYQQLTGEIEYSKEKSKEDAIIAKLYKNGSMTKRELTQSIRGLSSTDVLTIIPALIESGRIVEQTDGKTTRYTALG